MSKEKEKVNPELKRGRASFNLVGAVKIGDYTYKTDVTSNSGWQYNSLNLGVDCGNGNVVYADMMGGFSTKKENILYVNSKEDFNNRYTIDWEDRFLEPIIETIHPNNFITIGLEKDAGGSTFKKNFLSAYDAIAYIKEVLEDGMVVNVKGDLKYSIYNDSVQIKKEIKSIFLSKAEPEKYRSTFIQTILIDKDCIGKLDKETNSYPISARVLDYAKMYNDKEVKTNIPFFRQFELEKNEENPNVTKALLSKFFKVDKGITEIIVEGNIIEGQQTTVVSEADIPQDILDLIEIGVYSKEEILNKMAVTGTRVKRYVITKPFVQMVGENEEDKKPKLFITHEKYQEEDLILDFMFAEEDKEEVIDGKEPEEAETSDDDWMKALDGDDDISF